MGSKLIDILVYAFSLLLAAVPIIVELNSKEKKSPKYIASLSILAALLLIFGIIKIQNDNTQQSVIQYKLDSTITKLTLIKNKLTEDSTNRSLFEKKLFSEFKIKRDTISNSPYIQKNFTTNIENARVVNIGDKK